MNDGQAIYFEISTELVCRTSYKLREISTDRQSVENGGRTDDESYGGCSEIVGKTKSLGRNLSKMFPIFSDERETYQKMRKKDRFDFFDLPFSKNIA